MSTELTPRQRYDVAEENLRRARDKRDSAQDELDTARKEYQEADMAYCASLRNQPRE